MEEEKIFKRLEESDLGIMDPDIIAFAPDEEKVRTTLSLRPSVIKMLKADKRKTGNSVSELLERCYLRAKRDLIL